MEKETFIEPTVKDVREICREYELGRGGLRLSCSERTMYNDRRRDDKWVRVRRIKILHALSHSEMAILQSKLIARFPAHQIVVGPYLGSSYGTSYYRYTTIQIVLDKEKYRSMYPTKKVTLTIDEIAQLAGCHPDEVTIVK